MPNWVSNNLFVSGKSKDVDKFVKFVQRTKDEATDEFDETPLCFQKIIPRPASQSSNWYEWNIANWGTKWGACRAEAEIDVYEGSAIYRFDTAWSFPEPIIRALIKKFKKLEFSINAIEESNSFWTEVEGNNGKIISFEYGEFDTCADYQKFNQSHHYCPECDEWTDECNNSNIQELVCDECQKNIEATDKELWEGELNGN